jgi:hypothetical protein
LSVSCVCMRVCVCVCEWSKGDRSSSCASAQHCSLTIYTQYTNIGLPWPPWPADLTHLFRHLVVSWLGVHSMFSTLLLTIRVIYWLTVFYTWVFDLCVRFINSFVLLVFLLYFVSDSNVQITWTFSQLFWLLSTEFLFQLLWFYVCSVVVEVFLRITVLLFYFICLSFCLFMFCRTFISYLVFVKLMVCCWW